MKLSNANIADSIKKIQAFFDSLKVPRKDKFRVSLLLEEALLRYQEKFGEDYEFHLTIKKWFGTPKVLLRIYGKPYNPIEDESDEQIFSKNIMNNLLNYEVAGINYRYENGYNEISAFSTKKVRKKIPIGLISAVIIFPIILGILCKNFSIQTQHILADDIITPLLNALLGALVAINLPLIFISIVAGICAIENVTMLHEIGSKILRRFFALMFLIAFFTALICMIIFPVIDLNLEGAAMLSDSFELKRFYALFLSIIPAGVFEPFIEKNILQILSLSFLTGICITILGNRVNNVKNLIMDLKQLNFKVLEIVFKLIPVIVFLCLFKTALISSAAEILNVWRIIVAKYILFIVISSIMLWYISLKYGVKISEFMKKIYPAFLISLKSASGVASLEKNLEISNKELKIEKSLCDFYIPLSHSLCPTTLVISIVVNVFFAAHFSDAQISISQMLILIFLAVQFAISSAGGNGGIVAIMSILLTQLGFSLESIGPMMLSDLFTVNFACAAALIIRDCDLLDLSHKIKINN